MKMFHKFLDRQDQGKFKKYPPLDALNLKNLYIFMEL